MKYRVEFLELALDDLKGIAAYISDELNSPNSANHLIECIVGRINTLADFPYAYTIYVPIRPLLHEMRKMVVQNYSVFYWIDEDCKNVTIARVLYNRRDLVSIF